MANDKKIIVNRNEILEAWYEADDATVAETEARKEYQRLYSIAEGELDNIEKELESIPDMGEMNDN